MIEAITAMQGLLSELGSLAGAAGGTDGGTAAIDGSASSGTSFADLFNAALDRLDGAVSGADTKAQRFAAGSDDIPLSDVMVSLEQANLALQMAGNIRDKVTTAYSNVMNMQL
jgi:flagellar hook-basal body complex protein FliE